MSTIGIIANPASGKDIRRLVAHASVFDNNEKTNILQRILLALDAIGVDRALIMPDYYGLGPRALDGIRLSRLRVEILDMPTTGTDRDSTEAAVRLQAMGVGAILVLGGDGTNRVVAKGCGDIPLVPISTGTNNVFPAMVEGTVAGLAAGIIAMKVVDLDRVAYRAKRLEVYLDHELVDIALIDVVTSSDLWIGTRALWNPSQLREVVLARAEPGSIGLSSLGSCFQTLGARDEQGMYLCLGPDGIQMLAPLGPGLVTPVGVQSHRLISLGEEVRLESGGGTLALDGEREIEIYGRQEIVVRLTQNGPQVVDISRCITEAANLGFFCQSAVVRL
ncbi:MAG: ATP-NAD kinase family protein [Anaerolineae bacterium]